MPKDLPFFKFKPTGWMFGKIQKRSKDAKVSFMDLMCKYWHERCVYSLEDAKLDFGEQEINELVTSKVIKVDADMIKITFLDEQLSEIEETSQQNSLAGKESAKARARKAKFNTGSAPVELTSEASEIDKILIETYFTDLPNSSHLETIARNNGLTVEALKAKIPKFRKTAELQYPTFELFIRHFKNWIKKEMESPEEKPKQTHSSIQFGSKNKK